MDANIHFDTHTSIKRLADMGMDAGVDEAQAEAIVYVQADAMSSKLATKQDLVELKVDIIKWTLMAMIGQTGIILAFVNFAH